MDSFTRYKHFYVPKVVIFPQVVLKYLFSWFRKVYNVHILQPVLVCVPVPLYVTRWKYIYINNNVFA